MLLQLGLRRRIVLPVFQEKHDDISQLTLPLDVQRVHLNQKPTRSLDVFGRMRRLVMAATAMRSVDCERVGATMSSEKARPGALP